MNRKPSTTQSRKTVPWALTSDMTAYDAFYRRLTDGVDLKGVRSRFVMEVVHRKLALPLGAPVAK